MANPSPNPRLLSDDEWCERYGMNRADVAAWKSTHGDLLPEDVAKVAAWLGVYMDPSDPTGKKERLAKATELLDARLKQIEALRSGK